MLTFILYCIGCAIAWTLKACGPTQASASVLDVRPLCTKVLGLIQHSTTVTIIFASAQSLVTSLSFAIDDPESLHNRNSLFVSQISWSPNYWGM
jgi:hypothetical protein